MCDQIEQLKLKAILEQNGTAVLPKVCIQYSTILTCHTCAICDIKYNILSLQVACVEIGLKFTFLFIHMMLYPRGAVERVVTVLTQHSLRRRCFCFESIMPMTSSMQTTLPYTTDICLVNLLLAVRKGHSREDIKGQSNANWI